MYNVCVSLRERARQRVELNACQFWVTISIRIEAIVAFSADVCRIKLKLIKFLFSALLLCFFSSSPTVDAAIVFRFHIRIHAKIHLEFDAVK